MSAPPPPPSASSLPHDYIFKVLMVGDSGVGKSSMLLRFTEDSYDEHIQSTIGVDFKIKHLDVNNKKIKLTLWDTAGQERFRTMTSSYYRGAQGAVLVYDVTRMDTFEGLQQWLDEINAYAPSNGESVIKMLVGNKIDLVDERVVDRDVAEDWAREHGMLFLEASASTKAGIKQCFMEVVHKIVEDPELLLNSIPGKSDSSKSANPGRRRRENGGVSAATASGKSAANSENCY